MEFVRKIFSIVFNSELFSSWVVKKHINVYKQI